MLDAWAQNMRGGIAALERGNYKQAVKQISAALRRAESKENEKQILQALTVMGSVRREMGDLSDDTLNLFRRALEIGEKLYAPDDIRVGELYFNLGTYYLDVEDREEAARYFDRSAQCLQSGSIGEKIRLLESIAAARYESGDYVSCEELCRQIHPLQVEAHGDQSVQVAKMLSKHAIVLEKLGRAEESRQIDAQANQILKEHLQTLEELVSI